MHLLGKKKAADDSTNPSYFRPIALTSSARSLPSEEKVAVMVSNNFLNATTQKAFIDGVPDCSEHHLKLLTIIWQPQRRRKSLCVCRLDLANTFGSVHHDPTYHVITGPLPRSSGNDSVGLQPL